MTRIKHTHIHDNDFDFDQYLLRLEEEMFKRENAEHIDTMQAEITDSAIDDYFEAKYASEDK